MTGSVECAVAIVTDIKQKGHVNTKCIRNPPLEYLENDTINI